MTPTGCQDFSRSFTETHSARCGSNKLWYIKFHARRRNNNDATKIQHQHASSVRAAIVVHNGAKLKQ